MCDDVSDRARSNAIVDPSVHRFAAGHQIRLVIAGAATNYRGGMISAPVTITGGDTGQVLTLPVTP